MGPKSGFLKYFLFCLIKWSRRFLIYTYPQMSRIHKTKQYIKIKQRLYRTHIMSVVNVINSLKEIIYNLLWWGAIWSVLRPIYDCWCLLSSLPRGRRRISINRDCRTTRFVFQCFIDACVGASARRTRNFFVYFSIIQITVNYFCTSIPSNVLRTGTQGVQNKHNTVGNTTN